MSENQREIHVDRVIIRANEVIIEPERRRRPRPWFGGPMGERQNDLDEVRGETEELAEENQEDHDHDHHDHDHDDHDDHEGHGRRRPFSWI